jgi:hypothetical protein
MEHLKKIIDDNSSAVLDQAMNSLTQQFQDLKIKKIAVYNFMIKVCSITFKKAHFHPLARNNEVTINKRHDWVIKWTNGDMDYLLNCVFIDEAGFHINLWCSMGWSEKGHAPIVQVATSRATSHTILCAICAAGVVNTCNRKPNTQQPKKLKLGNNCS